MREFGVPTPEMSDMPKVSRDEMRPVTPSDQYALPELPEYNGEDPTERDRWFTKFYMTTHKALLYTGIHKLRIENREDLYDILQETYLRAYRGLGKFRGDGNPKTWLHRIFVNTSLSYFSRQRHPLRRTVSFDSLLEEDETLEPVSTAWEDDTENVVLYKEKRDRVAKAIQGLSPKIKDVIVLRWIDDYSHAEIADQLGITESASKVRLHRGKASLPDVAADEGEAA